MFFQQSGNCTFITRGDMGGELSFCREEFLVASIIHQMPSPPVLYHSGKAEPAKLSSGTDGDKIWESGVVSEATEDVSEAGGAKIPLFFCPEKLEQQRCRTAALQTSPWAQRQLKSCTEDILRRQHNTAKHWSTIIHTMHTKVTLSIWR